MADFIKMQTKGFEIFDDQLQALETKVAKGIVRKAVRGGAKATLKKVKSNAQSMVGGNMGNLLAKHAKIIVFGHQRRGSYGVQIGMKPRVPEFDSWRKGSSTSVDFSKGGKIGKTTGKSYIPAAIEYGHGNARPIPFIRSAWDATKRKDVQIMSDILRREITKAVNTRGVQLSGI
jgi:hypothetical protein